MFFPQAYALMLWSIIGGSCHKYHFSRGNFSRNKTFVATNISRDKHNFTKHVFCRDRSILVTTKRLSQQTRVCYDKDSWRQKLCHDKHTFVETKDVFCLEKHMFVATNDKTFVPTKIILVAAPANDSGHAQPFCAGLPRW